MNIDEKIEKISEKPQARIDKIAIILGLSLAIASCCSFFVIEVFGQQEFILDCPKNAYHGIDNQGNEVCRDILTNQIIESVFINLNSEKITNSDSQTIIDPKTREIIVNYDQFPTTEIIILLSIVIIGSIIGVLVKKGKLEIFQKRDWTSIQKEQVRNRQFGNCNNCFTQPSQWKYDYFDGNKNNNDLNNCQGLCSNCFSIKIERDNKVSIYNLKYD